MKALFKILIITFVFCSCGEKNSSSPGSKPQLRALSNDCAKEYLSEQENLSLAQVAQMSFEVAQKCKLDIKQFEKDLIQLKGVRYE